MKLSKKIIALMFCLSTSAQTPLEYWTQLKKDFSLNSSKEKHSMCYTDAKGELVGSNTYTKVRLASTSKLITTMWAIDKLGADYQYQTKFYFNGKHLHIQGSLDPVFSKRKLFFLLNQFNNLGIHEIDKITFDDNFRVYTKAERYTGFILNVTHARTAANFKDFLNTPTWNRLKTAYKEFINTTPKRILDDLQIERNLEELDLKIGTVSHTSEDIDLSEAQGYVHLSPAISVYMKYMNVVSNNFFADQIFEKLGGEKEFDTYLTDIVEEIFQGQEIEFDGYKKGEKLMKMYTGSGLNTNRNGRRVDNYSNCALMVRLIERLENKIEEANKSFKKIAAVVGVDAGTFRKRLRSPRLAKSIIAKTGTLYHTTAIAGSINTAENKRYFGVFQQLTGWKGGARQSQDKMIAKLWETVEGEAFDYKPEFFFPASQTLAPLN
jgi:D-alanyl-D-alanine carboxypeptidase/D-alanyl-D-alanine-endopeptidase (penicillin-binding protein 4)